jgi:hypothetical protein
LIKELNIRGISGIVYFPCNEVIKLLSLHKTRKEGLEILLGLGNELLLLEAKAITSTPI